MVPPILVWIYNIYQVDEMSRIILVATADYVWVESAREIIAYLGGLR